MSSKDKETKKRSYSDSSSEDERKSKKHRKEKKEKKHKKEKKDKKDKKEKKEKQKKNFKDYKLDHRDYDNKLIEFEIWLLATKKIRNKDLSLEQSFEIFKTEFVEKWNSGKLQDEYYDGTFRKNSVKVEKNEESQVPTVALPPTISDSSLKTKEEEDDGEIIGPRNPNEEEEMDEEDKRDYAKWMSKRQNKLLKQEKATTLEELEAKREKKKMKSEYTRVKKDETEGLELGDDQLFGGEMDVKKRIEYRRQIEEKKKMERMEIRSRKMEEYQKKEMEKLAPFLALLNSGLPIPLSQQKPQ